MWQDLCFLVFFDFGSPECRKMSLMETGFPRFHHSALFYFEATSGKTLEVIVKEISVDKGSDLAQTSAKLKRKTQLHASN